MTELFEESIGKLRYAVGIYEKLLAVTFPIVSGVAERKFFLLLTLDLGVDCDSIVKDKMLPLVAKNGQHLV
jgi:hypothetical protein